MKRLEIVAGVGRISRRARVYRLGYPRGIETMSCKPLDNYIRTHRRKAALSQDELAFLLGCEHGTKISRYERGRRTPTFETLLALEAVFGVSIRELFAGRFHQVEQSVGERAQKLIEILRKKKPSAAVTVKLSLLMEICERSKS